MSRKTIIGVIGIIGAGLGVIASECGPAIKGLTIK